MSKFLKILDNFLKNWVPSGAKVCKSCRSRKNLMLKNDHLVAKIGVDTAENEPRKEWCVFAWKASSPLTGSAHVFGPLLLSSNPNLDRILTQVSTAGSQAAAQPAVQPESTLGLSLNYWDPATQWHVPSKHRPCPLHSSSPSLYLCRLLMLMFSLLGQLAKPGFYLVFSKSCATFFFVNYQCAKFRKMWL